MKELYTSPEAKILCFAPVESLATNIEDPGVVLFSSVLDGAKTSEGGQVSDVTFNPELDLEFDA